MHCRKKKKIKEEKNFTRDDAQVMTQQPGNVKMSLSLKDFSKSSKLLGK